MDKIYTSEYFRKKGAKGAKKRNKLHNASEITQKGWATRKRKLDSTPSPQA